MTGLAAGLAAAGCAAWAAGAQAQTRAETLRQITGATINTLDPTMVGSTREAFGLSMNVYDHLVAFERKAAGNGYIFDPTSCAASWPRATRSAPMASS